MTTTKLDYKALYENLLPRYQELVKFYDKHNGTPCEQIKQFQDITQLAWSSYIKGGGHTDNYEDFLVWFLNYKEKCDAAGHYGGKPKSTGICPNCDHVW